MATNPPSGDGHRNGAVRKRSQVFNPKTEQWVKRDKDTGRFIDVKKEGTPFKVVTKKRDILTRARMILALIYFYIGLSLIP
jgi:hypothetical protein